MLSTKPLREDGRWPPRERLGTHCSKGRSLPQRTTHGPKPRASNAPSVSQKAAPRRQGPTPRTLYDS